MVLVPPSTFNHEQTMKSIALSTEEASRLSKLEKQIDAGKHTWVAVGNALEEIRDRRLYRKDHKTFEEYCQKRWGWSSRHGNRVIKSASAVKALTDKMGPIGPISECGARALAEVPKECRHEVWQEASKNGEPVTAKSVDAAAAKVKAKDAIRVDEIGRRIPKDILVDWDRAVEVATRLRSLVSKVKVELENGLGKDVIFSPMMSQDIATARQLHHAIGEMIPHAVCPYCQGRLREKCSPCKQRGWVNKHLWSSVVPREIKAVVEKQVSKGDL